MKTEISIRDYQPEDVQALANVYYNRLKENPILGQKK
jgi:hypothetical protein